MADSNCTKKCTKCKRVLGLSGFIKRDGRRITAQCKRCIYEIRKAQITKRLSNPEAYGLDRPRTCNTCGQTFPFSEFRWTASYSVSKCKGCIKKQRDAHLQKVMQERLREANMPNATATCRCCKKSLPLDAFYVQPACKSGRWKTCRKCISEVRKRRYRTDPKYYNRYTKYDLLPEQYDAMVAAQGGRCAICRKIPSRMHVDHDHTTGEVRGLLCGPCNQGIGLLRDSPKLLRAAIRYLKKQTGRKPQDGKGMLPFFPAN